jgi:hypothetical protein
MYDRRVLLYIHSVQKKKRTPTAKGKKHRELEDETDTLRPPSNPNISMVHNTKSSCIVKFMYFKFKYSLSKKKLCTIPNYCGKLLKILIYVFQILLY